MPKLDLETHALVGELASGDVLVALAASPDLASVGDEDEGLLAARLYLSETLSRVAPDEIVRFDLPRDTSLHQTTVLVPREDLARRWAITTPISVTSLVLPDPPDARGLRHRWVMLLRPRHTFYVPADEDLDEAVAHEVKRLCAAREITPEQYLELLPLRRERLAPVRVTFERGMSSAQARAADGKKRLGVLEAKKAAFAVLESVATLVRPGSPRPFPLRDAERELLGRLLGGVDRASVLLVGPERVGKSGLFAAWHERERAEGGTRPVFATSGARLIAGMSGFGQWQERVRRVMEAAHTLDAILYFDDFADLFAERPGGAIDVPGAMRPWIEDGRVRVVGEIRDTILDRIEARNAALFACFGRVRLEPLDAAAAKSVVVAVLEHDKKSHVALPAPGDAALDALIELAERYLPYESFPGKAVRLMSELRAAVAASVGSRASEPDFTIGARDVHAWFSERTGVPTFLLTDAERLDVADTVRALGRRLVGQEEAVRRVAELVSVVKAGLSPAGKPLATLLFVGPTGVGKTELARALAELLFGDEGRLARFDMSEYADAYAADRLFRGLDGGEGLLTRRVREEPFSVVLLDEIEKAHHGVFDLLLQICGEGRLTDGVGRTAFFHNAFVILTSNLGATDARPVAGFGGAAREPAAHYIRVVDETFRPELVNRIDRIIAFRSLDAAEARAVTRMVTSRAAKRRGLVERDIDLDVSDEALDLLAREGASATYGARALRRHVERALVAPLARLVSSAGAEAERARVVVSTVDGPVAPRDAQTLTVGGLRFAMIRGRTRRASAAAEELQTITAIRRAMDRRMRLEPIEELEDQVQYLLAQLAQKPTAHEDRDRDVAHLQGEHHRLGTLSRTLASAYEDICALEELALTAAADDAPSTGLVKEAEAVRARFAGALVHALVAMENQRNAATVMLLELDTNRAFDLWLAPLLRDATRRGYAITLHVDGGEKHESWPAERRWGPPQTPDWMLEQLTLAERPFRNLLLRASGDHVGIWLALEAGLHRFVGFGEGTGHMHVTLIARRSELTPKEWTPPMLDPPAPSANGELERMAPVRLHDATEGTVTVCGRIPLRLSTDEYWRSFEEVAHEHLLLFEAKALGRDRHAAFEPRLDDTFAEVIELLEKGRKIEAIKTYRLLTGASLKDAKDAVEAMA